MTDSERRSSLGYIRASGPGDEGFTLIELLVVVTIPGILTAITIPLFLNYCKGANGASYCYYSKVGGAIASTITAVTAFRATC